MPRVKLVISILIFSILFSLTSALKTQTRTIEKKIYKIDRKIKSIKKDLHETQLDFFYVSSPGYISNKIKQLALIDYFPMDFSRIYLNYQSFTDSQNKITVLKKDNEKKK
tara:strand:+ start:2793 stop:3122 length:330 start_codon:yes stop_codon:yes gene_type:complete